MWLKYEENQEIIRDRPLACSRTNKIHVCVRPNGLCFNILSKAYCKWKKTKLVHLSSTRHTRTRTRFNVPICGSLCRLFEIIVIHYSKNFRDNVTHMKIMVLALHKIHSQSMRNKTTHHSIKPNRMQLYLTTFHAWIFIAVYFFNSLQLLLLLHRSDTYARAHALIWLWMCLCLFVLLNSILDFCDAFVKMCVCGCVCACLISLFIFVLRPLKPLIRYRIVVANKSVCQMK